MRFPRVPNCSISCEQTIPLSPGVIKRYLLLDPETEKDEKGDYKAVSAPEDDCSKSKMTQIPTKNECKLACKLMGQKDEDWEEGHWGTAYGCFVVDPKAVAPVLTRHFKKKDAYCKYNKWNGHKGSTAPEAREICRAKDAVPA